MNVINLIEVESMLKKYAWNGREETGPVWKSNIECSGIIIRSAKDDSNTLHSVDDIFKIAEAMKCSYFISHDELGVYIRIF